MSTNRQYKEKAHRYIPGGAHTYSRGDDQYPVNAPPVLVKGKDAYVWDAEGNRYLDYGMALRAVTLGYAFERVNQAGIEEILKGNNLTRPSTIEIDAAEAMVELIGGMDMVKFAKNGSTATSAAVKLARAYSGKKYIARCADHPFFSYDDWFIGSTVVSNGVPKEFSQLTLQFQYNDLPSLEALFIQYPGEIAGVILEPATTMVPKDGFLQGIKELCQRNGSVFILDEMITGFRWHLKGAQYYYDVIPDLCTFGKGMANGFSVAALLGKREIMEIGGLRHQGERVFLISTTHGAEMAGLGALKETIKVYKELKVVEHFWNYGSKLLEGMSVIARDLGLEQYFQLDGVPVSPNYICRDRGGQVSLEFRTLFAQEMIKNGVLMPWIALSYAHNETELDLTLEATRKSLQVYSQALEQGIEKFMLGPAIKPVFRKYN